MSALGHKQTFALHQPMSAYPNSDIDCVFRHLRFGPKADIRFHLGIAFRLLSDTNASWSRCHSALTFSQRGALDDNSTDSHQDLRAMWRAL
jgi:hypothetical protein